MTNAGKRRGRSGSGVAFVALLLLGALGCSDGGRDLRAEAADCFNKDPSEVQLVAEGPDFGGWSLFAVHDWDGHDYALDLESAWSAPGCGYPGDYVVSQLGGGSPHEGKQLRYVYGTASSGVSKVRVRYEGGAVVDIRPTSASGFDLRFFLDVREGHGGFEVVGLDASGTEISDPSTTAASRDAPAKVDEPVLDYAP